MLAKMIAWRPTRDEAIAELTQALANTRLYGVETNRIYLQQILAFEPFVQGEPGPVAGTAELSGRNRRGAQRRDADQRP